MLPEGFHWSRSYGTLWLDLHGRQLALCAALHNGRVRVDFVLQRRSEFFDSDAEAVRYVEAWARKWEAKIREEAGRPTVRGWTAGSE